jgi:hypothetical protein
MHSALNRFVCRLFGFLAVAAASAGVAAAQVTLSPNRVTFYTEPNFRGEALTVEAGANVETLDRIKRSDQRPWTFAISSIRVEGVAKAVVYSAPGFRGDSMETTSSIPDLYATQRGQQPGTTWDRCIVSLAVTGPQIVQAPPPPTAYDSPPQTVYVVPAPQRPPPPVVVREVRPRYDVRTADALIQRAFRDVLGRSADPAGLRHYRERLIREGWSERDLILDLQRSGEARSINADDAIRKMYREVLGRDPDPDGLNHYRSKWRDGWTQGQIRDDLRRSTEGRDANIRPAITRAYRELLGREPDAAGYATYERFMREQGWSERQVREALMGSDEYRQRRGRK